MVLRIASNTVFALMTCAALVVACSDTGVSVVGGNRDASPADVTPDQLAPSDVSIDAPDDVSIDAPADVAPDVATDVPVDTTPPRCVANGDCAGNPAGAVCDATTGRCVQCLAVADTCPAAQHCDAASNTCVAGCRVDDGCTSASDAGVTRTRCDTATHACVECVTNDHCAPGTLCVGSVCAPGCTAGSACPTGQTCCGGACVDTQRNTAHCGVCNGGCAVPNATPACMNGACAVATCTAPFADCDASATSGCETNTLTSVAHCGGCGMACAARANSVASCAAGRCAYECATGFADCDGDAANGCEVDTRTTLGHCGACGRACAPPNATAACVAGACAVASCNAGVGDCDAKATNGCETDTRATVAHCGACGAACPSRDNALSACSAGRCVIACLAGFADCDGDAANGCEVDTRTSLSHCGVCGRACAPTNATGSCAMGACSIVTCSAGFGDCDGSATTGCETDTRATPAHCGGCGAACPARAHASSTCAAATCGILCSAGFGDCDGDATNGCETDLSTTVAHCGRCGGACASGVCAGGVCQAPTCADRVRNGGESDVDCGGTCPACALCAACRSGTDCASGACSAAGRCTWRTEVYIDWLTTCHGPGGGGADATVASVPAGTYDVTALNSAGTVWNPVSYPSTGWFWYVTCENLAVPGLTTASGTYYPTPAAAFAALPRTTASASFAGGTLRCYFSDSACGDNQGGVRFRMERACP